jgi:hypothetical protein
MIVGGFANQRFGQDLRGCLRRRVDGGKANVADSFGFGAGDALFGQLLAQLDALGEGGAGVPSR